MALPPSGEITLNQIKAEFGRGNNLTAYYGVTSGIPSSGLIAVTDFYGKTASDFHYGQPATFTEINLGYYYSYVENDNGTYYGVSLSNWYGDNWGAYQDLGQTELSMSIANSGDVESVYNAYTKLWFVVDSTKIDANKDMSIWSYNNFVGANAIYYVDYDNYYYNGTYSWLSEAYYGYEYWMEMR